MFFPDGPFTAALCFSFQEETSKNTKHLGPLTSCLTGIPQFPRRYIKISRCQKCLPLGGTSYESLKMVYKEIRLHTTEDTNLMLDYSLDYK